MRFEGIGPHNAIIYHLKWDESRAKKEIETETSDNHNTQAHTIDQNVDWKNKTKFLQMTHNLYIWYWCEKCVCVYVCNYGDFIEESNLFIRWHLIKIACDQKYSVARAKASQSEQLSQIILHNKSCRLRMHGNFSNMQYLCGVKFCLNRAMWDSLWQRLKAKLIFYFGFYFIYSF